MVQSGFMGTSSGATRHLPQRGKAFLRVRFAYSSVGGKALGARGLRIPPTETLMVLADYYGVSMDYIMCRTKNPQMNQ